MCCLRLFFNKTNGWWAVRPELRYVHTVTKCCFVLKERILQKREIIQFRVVMWNNKAVFWNVFNSMKHMKGSADDPGTGRQCANEIFSNLNPNQQILNISLSSWNHQNKAGAGTTRGHVFSSPGERDKLYYVLGLSFQCYVLAHCTSQTYVRTAVIRIYRAVLL